MPFYAVAKGREVGVYATWAQCEEQVKGYSGAVFKKFKSESQAQNFIAQQHLQDVRECVQQSLAEVVAQSRAGANAAPAYMTPIAHIKQETPDYIPLESVAIATSSQIKNEPLDESLWFEDSDGDKELMTALSVLQEYPDASQNKPIKKEKGANTAAPARQTQRIQIGRYYFDVDSDGYVDVYIGGHGENIGSWNCTAGYGVFFGHNHPLNMAEAATGRLTRNVGEIEAAIEAIKIARVNCITKLCVHTGSEFLLKAVTFWMQNWKRNGWRNQFGKAVRNRKQFEQLDKLLEEGVVEVEWFDAKRERNVTQKLRAAENLAQLGADEYLEQHPSKDENYSMDALDFDYFF